ncbi:hypothetical protein [Achromobacter sp. NFACC18-2]|uniref:hypothetical protein n=1 Tax=Achromobacter sp. NFACC18-2 TaxID=1564112 RepID=UPI0008B3601F|nr:hypothetical protein [Achromobacter sp. NFACC18-2]SEJ85304.1 hypothetical protein SAMN03159494_03589 [Achromobacter sp. NFACC18-2]
MPGGLEVYGDSGQVQIDGSTAHITLLRKGTVVSGTTTPTGYGTSFARIAVNAGEILAFRPAPGQYANLYGRYNGVVSLIVTGLGTAVDYWVFSPHQASGLNYGLQVFNESGGLIYDTGRPVMNVVGEHGGTGGPVAWAASSVAVIPVTTYAGIDRRIEYLAPGATGAPDYMMFIIATMGLIAISGNTTTTANQLISQAATGPYNAGGVGPPTGWVYEGNNGVDNRFMVISTDNL